MAHVIDALIVTLGLDPSKYKQSQKDVDNLDADSQKKRDTVNKKNDKESKERARREKQDGLDRKKRTDELTGSIATMGRTLAGTILGFESLAGGVKYLGDLNAGQAALGRTATKIGIGADQLNIYGKAVEFAGGKSEDAIETFSKMAQEFSTFKISGGTPGPLLQLLTQKGVAFRDATGNLRDIGTILDELSAKTAKMNDADRANLFAQAGISSGVINRMLETAALQKAQLDKAREYNIATAQSVKDAEELQEAWRGVGQAVDKVGAKVLTAVTPATKDAITAVTKLLNGDTKGAAIGAGKTALGVGQIYIDYAKWLYGGIASAVGLDGILAPKPGSLADRNNNPGNLRDRKTHEFRKFGSLIEGRAALHSDIDAKRGRGLNTIAQIITAYEGKDVPGNHNDVAAYIARAVKLTGKGANEQLTQADIGPLLNAMTAVESGLRDSQVPRTPSGATPGIVSNGKAGGAGGNTAGNTTTVHVEKIEVKSTNADPTAVANQTGDALQRKVTVAQANSGQN